MKTRLPISHSRRKFIGGAAGGFFGFAMSHSGRSLLAANGPDKPAKKLLVIWAGGGPSQFETFDPKPGRETSGGTKSITTAAKGIEIAESLPLLAKQMDKLSVIRNLTSREGEHERATYFLHTGYPFIEAFPRPALGSVMSQETGSGDLPGYVSVGNQGFGPAYLGMENGPFSIQDPGEARELLRSLESRRRRIQLTRNLSEHFSRTHSAATDAGARLAVLSRIERLIDTDFSKALDLENDPARSRYGDSDFAQRTLLARRLLETGVPFVEIFHTGWDTHQENAKDTTRLCREIDQPWAALMDDLSASGLLDETIVIWLGEFGRTPKINASSGRDHFPAVVPVVIGGGGFAGGQIVGKTNRDGSAIDGESYEVADLFATILNQIGVKPNTKYATGFGSMTRATDGGKVIAELR